MNCYFEYNSTSTPQDHGGTGPCGQSQGNSIVQCCDVGDYCLSNGICQFGKSVSTGLGVSGYYIAGCTDSTFKDPACMTNCTAYDNSDVTYDWNQGVWRCCGTGSDGTRNCSVPIGGPMTAPPPQALATFATIIGTGSMLPVATGPAVGGANAQADQLSIGGSGISVGLVVGVTVAGMIGLLLLIAIPAIIIWRRKRRSLTQTPSHRQYPSIGQPISSPTLTSGTGGMSQYGHSQHRQSQYGQSQFGQSQFGHSQFGQYPTNDHYAQDQQQFKKLPSTPHRPRHELDHSSTTMHPPYASELGTTEKRL